MTTDDIVQRRALGPLRRSILWLGQHELATLLLVALVGAGTWGFIELASEVTEGQTREFDERLLLLLRNPEDFRDPLGPPWVEEMARDVTALGSSLVLASLTAAIAIFLWLRDQRLVALFLVAAVTGGMTLSSSLKVAFDRPRPDLVPHGAFVLSKSFPSGHTTISAVTYLTLAALLARVQPRRRIRAYLLCLGILLTVLVGLSRVYLGVHWPTDVAAGWAIGASWAAGCWLVFRWRQRQEVRGFVEE